MLVDEQDGRLSAFVEIDLGTMSHARLRQKAELYAAYAARVRVAHPSPVPARAAVPHDHRRPGATSSWGARGSALHGPRRQGRALFVAGAAGIVGARPAPGRALPRGPGREDGPHTRRHLNDREASPTKRSTPATGGARRRKMKRRRVLHEDSEAMREYLATTATRSGPTSRRSGRPARPQSSCSQISRTPLSKSASATRDRTRPRRCTARTTPHTLPSPGDRAQRDRSAHRALPHQADRGSESARPPPRRGPCRARDLLREGGRERIA